MHNCKKKKNRHNIPGIQSHDTMTQHNNFNGYFHDSPYFQEFYVQLWNEHKGWGRWYSSSQTNRESDRRVLAPCTPLWHKNQLRDNIIALKHSNSSSSGDSIKHTTVREPVVQTGRSITVHSDKQGCRQSGNQGDSRALSPLRAKFSMLGFDSYVLFSIPLRIIILYISTGQGLWQQRKSLHFLII